ncbi:MAG: heme o synthase [Thermoprotei archaeon]|nr:heme o synthase [Thermoprotei archaeon]
MRAFIELTKPRQMALLLLTMYGSYIVAGGPLDPILLAKLTIMGVTSVGGVTALNMYLDSDVDALMKRTRRRPLPSGRLTVTEALAGIAIMLLVGVTTAAAINVYVLFTVLAGLYFDIIGYTELTKRFTPLNIFLGSIAGAMPALGGWAAGAGSIGLPGIMLAGVVFTWQPLHVWFLAYFLEDDYRMAKVPMASLYYGPRLFSVMVASSLTLMALLILAFIYLTGRGYVSAAVSLILIVLAILRVFSFASTPSRGEAFRIFKLATPVLAVVYILLPLEFLVKVYVGIPPI